MGQKRRDIPVGQGTSYFGGVLVPLRTITKPYRFLIGFMKRDVVPKFVESWQTYIAAGTAITSA